MTSILENNRKDKTMEIVQMTEADVHEILEIEQKCFSVPGSENAFLGELANPLTVYIVAKDNGKCVGYCGYWSVAGEGDITNVAVAPEYRRAGIGSMLIKKLIECAVSEGLSQLTLEVRHSNTAAQRLYEKYGFETVGERTDYYQNPRENAWIMTKNLTI